MSTIQRFEEIEAWKTARELSRLIYRCSNEAEFARDFGLKDQMRRASVSVLSNTAEGFESRTNKLFLEFLGRAKGSAGELRAQAYVALDAGYFDTQTFEQVVLMTERVSKQIARFMDYLSAHSGKLDIREQDGEYHV